MPEERKVKVTLDLDLGSGSDRIIQDLIAQTQKATVVTKELKATMSGGAAAGGAFGGLPFMPSGAGVAGISRSPAGGAEPAGGGTAKEKRDAQKAYEATLRGSFLTGLKDQYSNIPAFFGRGAAALFGAASLNQTVGALGTWGHDPFMTGSQGFRHTLSNLDPFGISRSILGTVDSVTGRTAAMQKADIFRGQFGAVDVAATRQILGFNLAFKPEQAGMESRAASIRQQSPIYGFMGARSSAEGERAYREQARLVPLQQAQVKAEREAKAATAEHAESQSELNRALRDEIRLRERRTQIQRDLENDSGGPGRQSLLRQFENVNQDIQNVLDIQRRAREQVRTTGIRAAEAGGAAGRARIAATLGFQADIAEERAGVAAGSAQTLGGMNMFDRWFAIMSLRALQARGPEGLPPEMLAAAGRVAPQTVGKLLEGFGGGTREFQELQKLAPVDFPGVPEDLRREAAERRKEMVDRELEVERRVGEAIAQSGRDLGRFIINAINDSATATKEEILNSQKLGRNK